MILDYNHLTTIIKDGRKWINGELEEEYNNPWDLDD